MVPSGRSVYALVRRIVVLWAIEVFALWTLARLLPGLSLDGWDAAVLGVAAIALLNALVRPLLLFLTLPLTVLSFGVLTLVLNGVVLWLATLAVPDLHLNGFGSGVLAALGLTATNTLAAYVFALNEEESVYRNIIRRITARSRDSAAGTTPGLVMIEFDGVSATLLEHAMQAGYLPTLAKWIRSGSHRLGRWDCGVPSQTSFSQAGILFGNNFDIPGFRWFEKPDGKMMVSNDPADAMRIEQRESRGAGLLHPDGVSVFNMFSGDAARSFATISAFSAPAQQVRRASPLYFSYYLSPYTFTRSIALIVREFIVEWWESGRQRVRNVQPRVSRGGLFPLLRAMSTVAQRELGTYTLIHEMFAGVPVAYITYVGYDVVAHHAGPESPDALRILRDIDQRVAMIARAAQDAPRPYRFVVLSDHGQSRSIPFRQRYGVTIDHAVQSLLSGERTVLAPPVMTEGWGHLNALLTEAIRHERLTGRTARRLLRHRTRQGLVELGREPQPVDAEIVVCPSGNLANIYFRSLPHHLTLEEIAANYPGFIEGLVAHAGIGFVMVRSSLHGLVVMGRDGLRYLNSDRIEGADPLAGYGAHAAGQLARLGDFPHCGDVILNGRFDPQTGEVTAFEEMVGAHGGLGGPQTEAFLLRPAAWPVPATPMINPESIFQLLTRWRDALLAGENPAMARVDGLESDAL
ncbi:MAG TPA: phage holin family protein [Candidatus Krumholzibacteria bacterium]|nr:phage holin family protein [Candidatus Krumholzibacteria bacterium]